MAVYDDSKRPAVFISYSWDSEEHKRWVLKLSCDLRTEYGIDVMMDSFVGKGQDLVDFMEEGIRNASKVLVIGTPEYKRKSEKVSGGVKYEQRIIKASIFSDEYADKFIPVLRAGEFKESFPEVLMSRNGFDMSKDDLYTASLYDLACEIWDRPEIIKPALGPVPTFVNNTNSQETMSIKTDASERSIDDTIDHIKRTIASPQRLIEFSDIVESETGYLIEQLNNRVFTTDTFVKDLWDEAWQQHTLASERMCRMSNVMIRWAKPEHQNILVTSFKGLVNRRIDTDRYLDGTVQLNYISPLLLFYTFGVRCLCHEKYAMLDTLLSLKGKMWSDHSGEKTPIVDYLNLWLFDNDGINRLELSNRSTPLSAKIMKCIRPYFSDLQDEDFDAFYDIFEYLFNLYLFLLGSYPGVLPITYTWRRRQYQYIPDNAFDAWFNDIEKKKGIHPIFSAGMFNGRYEDYAKVKASMDKGMSDTGGRYLL